MGTTPNPNRTTTVPPTARPLLNRKSSSRCSPTSSKRECRCVRYVRVSNRMYVRGGDPGGFRVTELCCFGPLRRFQGVTRLVANVPRRLSPTLWVLFRPFLSLLLLCESQRTKNNDLHTISLEIYPSDRFTTYSVYIVQQRGQCSSVRIRSDPRIHVCSLTTEWL